MREREEELLLFWVLENTWTGKRWVQGRGGYRKEVGTGKKWVQGKGGYREEVGRGKRWVGGRRG